MLSSFNQDLREAGVSPPAMRITSVRIHHLTAKLKERFGWSLDWTEKRSVTLVEVNTDAGLTGWGEGSYGGDRLRQHPELVLGRSPFEVEAIYDDLRPPAAGQFDRGEPTSAGLDVALWDIVGRALNRPVSSLLGRRHSICVNPYCTCMYRKDWPDPAAGLAEEALAWVSKGFRDLNRSSWRDLGGSFLSSRI